MPEQVDAWIYRGSSWWLADSIRLWRMWRGFQEPHWSSIIYSYQPVTGYTVAIYSLTHSARHSWSAWLLKVGLIHHRKTLITNYQPMPHSFVEDWRSQVHCSESLKSHTFSVLVICIFRVGFHYTVHQFFKAVRQDTACEESDIESHWLKLTFAV
jgi:hypothetical protein